MSSLAYSGTNLSVHGKWGGRDVLCVLFGILILWLAWPFFEAAQVKYQAGALLQSVSWGAGAIILGALTLTLTVLGFTHEASSGIRQFFRDACRRQGFCIGLLVFITTGLTLYLGSLALVLIFGQGALWSGGGLLVMAFGCFVACALSFFAFLGWFTNDYYREGSLPF